MKKRAKRREQENRGKNKAKKIMKDSWGWTSEELLDNRHIGKIASTHGKPCSCPMCGNPRRHFHEVTMQEKRAEKPNKYDDKGE